MPSPRPAPQDRRSGFALLITITLLAFLVLLLVSLASLTRVETQVASNNQQLSQARQNALMALNVALGRLQAAAGPDQRITATADLVSGVNNDKRRWTGVWNTTVAAPAPEWLVSSAAATPPSGTAAVATALPATGTVPLVGNHSVDTDASNTAGNAVVVETQPITSASVAGVPGNQTIGNFAYWVGDEGVKAKVSLTNPWPVDADSAAELSYQLHGAQRFGIESVESAPGAPLAANFPANSANLSKLLDLKQLPLSHAPGQAVLTDAARSRFHDLTARSGSVLADVARGGLKKDLTAWLAHSPANLATGLPADDDLIFPRADPAGSDFGIPKWGIIRSYAGLSSVNALPPAPQPQTPTQHGLHPLITYFRLSFGVSWSAATQSIDAHMFPVLALWNPHNTRIAASTYELVFGTYDNIANVRYTPLATNSPGELLLARHPKVRNDTNGATEVNGQQATRGYTRLLVDCPILEPGESLVFTLADSGPYWSPGDTDPAHVPIRLIPQDPVGTPNSLTFESLTNPHFKSLTTAQRTANANVTIRIPGGSFELALYPAGQLGMNARVSDFRQLPAYQLFQRGGMTQRTGTMTAQPEALPGPSYWFRQHITDNLNSFYTMPRWLAHHNPRSALQLLVPATPSNLTNSFAYDSQGNAPGGEVFDGNRRSVGLWQSTIPAEPLVISELPNGDRPQDARLFSVAQLQHANLSLLGQHPTYAVGNSEVSPFIGRTASSAAFTPTITASNSAPAHQLDRVYDVSYLLNQALWDRYFFSTIPRTITPAEIADANVPLPNSRHRFLQRDGVDPTPAVLTTDREAPNTAAAHLVLDGGFNVNSTSEQAWRALLASHIGLDSAGSANHPYSRFSDTVAGNPANTPRSSGYRILSDAQINRLAANIVAEVRTRGPFLSLADFVNRRLRNDPTGFRGALQSAIAASDTSTTAAERLNDFPSFTDSAYQVGTASYLFPARNTTDLNHQKNHFASDEDPSTARTRPSGSRAAFMPGFLSQADLLNSLGPVLTARSDTFTIRAYGDVQNPTTNAIEGRAWCEAVVQRSPDFVNASADAPHVWPPVDPTDQNQTFGRRFTIVSFRWLSADDI